MLKIVVSPERKKIKKILGNSFKYDKLYFHQLFESKFELEETRGLTIETKLIIRRTGRTYKIKISRQQTGIT